MASLLSEGASLLVRNQAEQALGGIGGDKEEEKSSNDVRNRTEGFFGCFTWCWNGCKKNPCNRQGCIMCGWIIMGILAPILFTVYESLDDYLINYGYISACILSILMSFCATCLWQDVYDLRVAIDDFELETKQTEENAKRVKKEVINLSKAHRKLVEIEEDISSNNAELRLKQKQFKKWTNDIKGSTEESINYYNKIKKTYKQNIKRYKRKIEQNEREILDKAYHHVQYHNDKIDGLNEEEFDKMMQILPQRFIIKMEKRGKTFSDFAGRDNYLQWDEFAEFMEEMIEQDVENGIDIPGDDDNNDV